MTLRDPTTLGDVLRTAREARFIDLARVNRDTRIKVRYLAALERGEYRDLPAAVYVKGFLRNYGLYLGLDPQQLLDLYRAEQGGTFSEQRRPGAKRQSRSISRRSGLTITPGMVVTVLVGALVLGVGAYFGGELLTFARTPTLTINEPAADVASWEATVYVLRGSTEPGATITISGLPENPTAVADFAGRFTVTARLLPGTNVISLVAHDPRTGRDSAVVRRTITVEVPQPSAPTTSGSE